VTSIPTIAILAGGLATRLGELTQSVPKSMLDIHGEPFIAHQLRQLRSLGAQEIVLCVGHLSKSIENFVGDGSAFGLSVVYSYDGTERQGTGGAIYRALDLLDEEFIVTYGDSFLDIDLESLTQFHRTTKLPATMAIYKNEGKWDKSNVRLASSTAIVYEQNPTEPRGFIDYGVSIISRSKFVAIAPDGAWELPTFFERLSESDELSGFLAKERFFEIGSSMGLSEFRNHVWERRVH
jgi:NDP-sugar pyrophosphorylase family protein